MGCMGFSHGYGKIPSEDYCIEAIRKALDYGCNFLDTSGGFFETASDGLCGSLLSSQNKSHIQVFGQWKEVNMGAEYID